MSHKTCREHVDFTRGSTLSEQIIKNGYIYQQHTEGKRQNSVNSRYFFGDFFEKIWSEDKQKICFPSHKAKDTFNSSNISSMLDELK